MGQGLVWRSPNRHRPIRNMLNKPLILDIKGNSLDDGPGIRTVVFFKGCPLSCIWCHNPESKSPIQEICFDPKECVGCDTCLDVCPNGALSRANPFYIDRARCNLCFECVEACPSGALGRVGREMTVDDILEALLKYKPFYDMSGGGVALSGGEPTLHMDFVSETVRALKEAGIHILLETCGFFSLDKFVKRVLPYLDIIYYDIKIIDRDLHKTYCGVTNELILKNFLELLSLSEHHGFAILPRIPLVPDITDRDTNLSAMADFLVKHQVKTLRLMAYNPLWHEKSRKIGVISPYTNNSSMAGFMSRERIDECKAVFRDAGLEV